jgi:hypothetical protein
MSIDLSLPGFDEDELARLLDPGVQEGLTDPDAVPSRPTSRSGARATVTPGTSIRIRRPPSRRRT